MTELLVVLLIFGILLAIIVPTLVNSVPQRNLAASGDSFANDVSYARTKAKVSGNDVYIAFVTQPDALQIQGPWDSVNRSEDNGAPVAIGGRFNNPANPGISRVSREYIIVEERPRFNADGSPYTYLNWLNDYDRWDSSDNDPPYPVEPLWPFNFEETNTSGIIPDPSLGPFNRVASPLVNSWTNMRSDTGSYETVHWSNEGLDGADWADGNINDQIYKVFCTADQAEILSYDVTLDFDNNGFRVFSIDDHPRLQDQVMDYVLLKRQELPEHVFFVNPWKDHWVTGWEDVLNPVTGLVERVYDDNNLQFLQYLWKFKPNGELALAQWTYDPEPFPNGSVPASLSHGTIASLDTIPTIRSAWMATDEALDFGSSLPIAKVSVQRNKKANLNSNGRMFTFWSISGKYYVDDYTPNDSARSINEDDPRLNKRYDIGGTGEEIDESLLVSRETGWAQNFLAANP